MFLADDDTILQVEHVSKIYSRSRQTTQRRLTRTLSRAVFGRRFDPMGGDLRQGEFYAVNDVNFSLKRGEALGIIGLNGSGKTTLLRMLAGQLLPDDGTITVVGRTASMIDLTAGFQVTASGRENIFLRGAALGRSREQMQADFDAIVDFAELGDAIGAPVATYSSGMMMRLAFSIVAAVAPDLLFIDEVLAVGDFRFRQKCLARVRDLRQHSAFVMVTHSMTDVIRFCERTLVLNKGVPVFLGPSAEAVEFFETKIEQQPIRVAPLSLSNVTGPVFNNPEAISDVSVHWADAQGQPTPHTVHGEPQELHIAFRCHINPRNLIVGIPVWREDGTMATGFSTDTRHTIARDSQGFVRLKLHVPAFAFNPGTYSAMLSIVDGAEFLWRNSIAPLSVKPAGRPTWGMVSLDYRWLQD